MDRRRLHRAPAWAGWRVFVGLFGFTAAAAFAGATEVQQHGVVFEKWIRDTFFDHYAPESYTQKWDIPAAANRHHGGIPVNPKAARHGAPIGLGDALRQYDIDEPFLLLLGYWEQDGASKRFVTLTPVKIHPETWRLLWGDVSRADLERLDAAIKDRSLDAPAARQRAQTLKDTPPFSTSLITLNPKIGAGPHGQRRLQCSLRFDLIYDLLASDADRTAVTNPELWGVPFPGPVASAARTFADDES